MHSVIRNVKTLPSLTSNNTKNNYQHYIKDNKNDNNLSVLNNSQYPLSYNNITTKDNSSDLLTVPKPHGYWNDIKNHRYYLNGLANSIFHLRDQNDWFKIRKQDIDDIGGEGFLHNCYKGSLVQALQTVFPEYEWFPWQFSRVTTGYWEDITQQRHHFNRLVQKFGLVRTEDWLEVHLEDIYREDGGSIITDYYNTSLYRALDTLYPEYSCWKNIQRTCNYSRKFGDSLSKKHRLLYHIVQQIFNHNEYNTAVVEIFINYSHPTLVYQKSKKKMQFDLYIPSLSLAFEYQGEQHYEQDKMTQGLVSSRQHSRDKEKRDACREYLITLIEVPYHWDETEVSIRTLLQQERPDIIVSQ